MKAAAAFLAGSSVAAIVVWVAGVVAAGRNYVRFPDVTLDIDPDDVDPRPASVPWDRVDEVVREFSISDLPSTEESHRAMMERIEAQARTLPRITATWEPWQSDETSER